MHTVTTHRCAFDDAAKGKRIPKQYKLLAAGQFLVGTSPLFHEIVVVGKLTAGSTFAKQRIHFAHCTEVLVVCAAYVTRALGLLEV
jgi:hypothetical protein